MLPVAEVFLSLSLLCFDGTCYSALVGKNATPTPVGEFRAVLKKTNDKGYDGRVITFLIDGKKNYSIHQTWKLIPSEKREWRIGQEDPSLRKITNGCINIESDILDKMINKSAAWKLIVRK